MTDPNQYPLDPDVLQQVENHNTLSPAELAVVETEMRLSPDAYGKWVGVVEDLSVNGSGDDDDRNHLHLAELIDSGPATLDGVKPAQEITAEERVESLEMIRAAEALARHARAKPRPFDPENLTRLDRATLEQRRSEYANMGIADEDAIKAEFAEANRKTDPMRAWEKRGVGILQTVADILQEHPEQSKYLLATAETLRRNAAEYYVPQRDEHGEVVQEALLVEPGSAAAAARRRVELIQTNPEVSNSSAMAADANVNLRDTSTAYTAAEGSAESARKYAETFDEFLAELPIDREDGHLAVQEFQHDFQAEFGFKIEDVVHDMQDPKILEAYLAAAPEDRLEAEFPLWRSINLADHAVNELRQRLNDMASSGMSPKHSHYRKLSELAVNIAKVSYGCRYSRLEVGQEHAMQDDLPASSQPNFHGRSAIITETSDTGRGLYLLKPNGEKTDVVYPDRSIRRVITDAAGNQTLGDRINADGSAWEQPEKITLTYEEAAPSSSTSGAVGRFATRLARVASPRRGERIDDRDLQTLERDFDNSELAWRMNPSDPKTVQRFYDVASLMNQRLNEEIATTTDPTMLGILQSHRGVTQGYLSTIRYGSEGDTGEMQLDGSIARMGEVMYGDHLGDWITTTSGFAWEEKTMPNGTIRYILYKPDGTRA